MSFMLELGDEFSQMPYLMLLGSMCSRIGKFGMRCYTAERALLRLAI